MDNTIEETIITSLNQQEWLSKIQRDKQGNIITNHFNADLIIKNDTKLSCIKYNELASEIVIVASEQNAPWIRNNTKDDVFNDFDYAQLALFLSTEYKVDFSRIILEQAVKTASVERKFHPIVDYFTRLFNDRIWDGVPRADKLLTTMLGVEDTPENRAVWHWTLIAIVNKAFNPYEPHQYMLVLQGPQGKGKSLLLKKLGGVYFTDTLRVDMMGKKEAWEVVSGTMIVEIQEMAGMKKQDENTVKAYITRTEDRLRPAYARTRIKVPVTSVTFGTTNSTHGFLKDTTGNRRFWSVPIEVVPHLSRSNDIDDKLRDQIWAEVVTWYMNGDKKHMPDPANPDDAKVIEIMEKRCNANLITNLDFDKISDYMNLRIPQKWIEEDNINQLEKKTYVKNNLGTSVKEEGTVLRNVVSVETINEELLEGKGKRNEIEQNLIATGEWVPYRNGASNEPDRLDIVGYGRRRNVYVRVGHEEEVLKSKELKGDARRSAQYSGYVPRVKEPKHENISFFNENDLSNMPFEL